MIGSIVKSLCYPMFILTYFERSLWLHSKATEKKQSYKPWCELQITIWCNSAKTSISKTMSWQERLDDNQDSMVVCNIPESYTNASNYTLLGRTTKLLRSSFTHRLYVHKYNLEIFRHTFGFSGISIWKSLTYEIQNSTSIQNVKRQYLRLTHPSLCY